jgi:hypothetical protein
MRKFEKLSRKYKYQVRQKYQQDPFAFLVLWSLFFSAVFLIFAFRGLIAATFMHKIGVSNELLSNEITNTDNAIDNSANAVDNQTNSPANNTETPADNTSNNTTDNLVNNSANEVQNTIQ